MRRKRFRVIEPELNDKSRRQEIMKKIPVIYEDNELIVCVKPQGVSKSGG